MPDKKSLSWFDSKKKWIVGATVGILAGLGVERGMRDKPEEAGSEQSYSSVEKHNKEQRKKSNQSFEGQELPESFADKQRQIDERKAKDVKKFIERIYSQEPSADSTNIDLESRHADLKRRLEQKIGDKFMIDEELLTSDEGGVGVAHYYVVQKTADGTDGEGIKIGYEADGTLSIQDEGMVPYVNIKQGAYLVDDIINQIHKVIRMRAEFNKYTNGGPDYPTWKYMEYLKSEGYDDAQINYILNVKYVKPADVIKRIDDNEGGSAFKKNSSY